MTENTGLKKNFFSVYPFFPILDSNHLRIFTHCKDMSSYCKTSEFCYFWVYAWPVGWNFRIEAIGPMYLCVYVSVGM